jgi:hypothetical protein
MVPSTNIAGFAQDQRRPPPYWQARRMCRALAICADYKHNSTDRPAAIGEHAVTTGLEAPIAGMEEDFARHPGVGTWRT